MQQGASGVDLKGTAFPDVYQRLNQWLRKYAFCLKLTSNYLGKQTVKQSLGICLILTGGRQDGILRCTWGSTMNSWQRKLILLRKWSTWMSCQHHADTEIKKPRVPGEHGLKVINNARCELRLMEGHRDLEGPNSSCRSKRLPVHI